MGDIYAETLIYAYEHPGHKKALEGANSNIHEENISCGDKIDVHIKIDGGKISDISFEGEGCVISMGTAEMLIDALKGNELKEVESMGTKELLDIISIDPGPVRMHCATLSLRAVKKAILEYEGKPLDAATKEL